VGVLDGRAERVSERASTMLRAHQTRDRRFPVLRRLVPFVVVSILVLSAVFALARAQTVHDIHEAPHWPPRPSEIVNISSANLQLPSTIASGASIVVYAVPSDESLVIVSCSPINSSSGGIEIAEDLGGVLTQKFGSPFADGFFASVNSPIGYTFRPGSNVVFKNTAAQSVSSGIFTMLGYLAR
jgi:hypothetical protein